MKKILLSTLFIFISLASIGQGHEIKFDIKNLTDSVVYLARYFGDNKYIKDTLVVENNTKFVIKGKESLPCGIYLIVREKKNSYMEFLVYDQKFSVKSDTSDFINKTTFKNSPSNEKLYAYFKKSADIGSEVRALSETQKKQEEAKEVEKAAKTKGQIIELNKEMNTYIDNFIVENPNNPMTVVFKLQKEVDVPDSLTKDKTDEGKTAQYRYYLNHYWDKTDFDSQCLIRTPLFHGKLQRYFDQVVPQHYDSIFRYAEPLIAKAKNNYEVSKYIINYVTFKWESGKDKRMCWDKVFYQMAKRYYLTGEVDWVNEVTMAKIKSRVDDLENSLCGEPAVNFKMKYYPEAGLYDTSGTLIDMYKLKADYVILWFWDSDCGHCKKQTPKLDSLYRKYKKEGKSLEIYAINIEQESKGYKKYLKEHNYTWINVQDTGHFSNFRKHYDIFSTPVSYILDKDRKIIGKRIDPGAIDKMMEQVFKEEEEQLKLKEVPKK